MRKSLNYIKIGGETKELEMLQVEKDKHNFHLSFSQLSHRQGFLQWIQQASVFRPPLLPSAEPYPRSPIPFLLRTLFACTYNWLASF